jgi:hypothetical protein
MQSKTNFEDEVSDNYINDESANQGSEIYSDGFNKFESLMKAAIEQLILHSANIDVAINHR